MNLENRTCIITGSSSGLGESIAKKLAGLKADIWLLARSEENLERVANDIRKSGGKANFVICDISSNESIDKAVLQIKEKTKSVDVLINNSGKWLQGSTVSSSKEDIKEVFDVNTLGTIFMTQAVLPLMESVDEAHILNVVSAAGVEPSGDWPIYTASKYAVRGFTDSLKAELAATNIKVSGFYPEGINTSLFTNAGLGLENQPWMMDKEAVADIICYILQQPKDIAISHIEVRKKMGS